MAKLRKLKPGEQREQSFPESATQSRADASCAVVRHQKLCLRIDIPKKRIYGHTALKVLAPTAGVFGLHSHGLNIESVMYEGLPVEFLVSSVQQVHSPEDGESFASEYKITGSVLEAADTAYAGYLRVLEKELAPELLIFLPKSFVQNRESQDSGQIISTVVALDKGRCVEHISSELSAGVTREDAICQPEEKLKLVEINYWVEKPEAGGHFSGHVFHTNNQLRRARCWFPCVDSELQQCCFDMEFTVNTDYIAASNGKLLYQVFSKEGPHLKTYVYKLDIPVPAHCISLVVAPLEVLPDRHNAAVSHFCLHGNLLQLQYTVNFFHSVFSYYEDYLGASFPFGCYNQVFVDSESMISSASIGASMAILSSHLLVDERVIDQTVRTRIKLAHVLAQQWFGVYITPDSPSDAWLLEGLAGFLTDMFIKRHFGNNEACYRRYKANEAVCKVDVEGCPPLSSCVGVGNLLGTEKFGVLGQIRSWKAVAVIQMLEKQMGPEPFRKILQRIILRAQDPVRNSRTLSTKEFRHFANKLGNLERPFLKEFFPRWVESPGCPVIRMGFVYNKRRNMIELAAHRGCTASAESVNRNKGDVVNGKPRADVGWPGMMSIRVHELDGMYDHPSLPMAGDDYQLLELQCHSKLAGRRIQRPKKGSKTDAADDVEPPAALDTRQGIESPLLWLRADPQMEYLAEIHLHQPEQMWINQLEKDKDVVAQIQAIAALTVLPRMSFAAVNALNNCLMDSKVFCRVRVEAAFAIANTATEATSWAGLSHLIKFYKSRRYDPDIGLPRPNDFHDLAEYFVLEVIPGAVCTVRGSDGTSPPEAVDFILQLIKHNDNSGNHYSDVFWLASLIESIGTLEFGHQSIQTLSRILKRIDRFLQYDRLTPSYNGLLTISCIRTLTELALKFSHVLPMDRCEQLLQPFRDPRSTWWKIRVEVLRSLFDLQVHTKGLNAGMLLAVQLVENDPSLKVQCKLWAHTLHTCILKRHSGDLVDKSTLTCFLHLLKSTKAFNNTLLRHHTFSLLQVLAKRPATLYRMGNPQIQTSSAVPLNNATIEEQKGKTGSFKVRIQCPQEFQPEPVRIRLVHSGSHTPKEAIPTASGSSSGKQEIDRKVGVLKLRLKPTSSTQETVMDGGNEKSLTCGPVQSSSVSMELGVKAEPTLDEILLNTRGWEDANIEESGRFDRDDAQKDTSTANDSDARWFRNSIDNSVVESAVKESVHPQRMKSLDVLVGRVESDIAVSSSDQDTRMAESHNEQQLEATYQEDVESKERIKLEDEDSSKLETGTTDEGGQKGGSDRRTKEAKKEKKRKREEGNEQKRDGFHHEKKKEKHSDPEYSERKRLKKEQKRREREQRRLQKSDNQGLSETAKVETNLIQKRHAAGTSETVVRLKFKKL